MPIQIDIFHPDRMVVVVGRGLITLEEYERFVADLVKAGVLHYRKIIDVTACDSSTVGQQELMKFNAAFRALAPRQRGPLAIVADPQRGGLARLFKELTSAERPVEVFRSIHDARRWLAVQSSDDS